MKKYETSEEIPDDELPENFDWRDVGGYNFLGPVRNQGGCGSCYTFSYIQLMQHRLQLKYGQEIPMLSPQQLMTCNYLTEGCAGGWSQMNGFFNLNSYLVEEECAPYQTMTKGAKCGDYEHCEPIAKVGKVKFVGGGFGASSEKAMMKEILHSGAIEGACNWSKYIVAGGYKEGIVTTSGLTKLHEKMVKLADMSP